MDVLCCRVVLEEGRKRILSRSLRKWLVIVDRLWELGPKIGLGMALLDMCLCNIESRAVKVQEVLVILVIGFIERRLYICSLTRNVL